ncbi:microcephalin [Andrena cerasifolii]|uniref:microcephalin n=1 Tax=Andrena cerasifolii TaxID=2819439 RepID=UPI004037886C
MSQNKRKPRIRSVMDESASFKHRRSSLQVNLSCVSKLTDSGNGSLRQMDEDNNNDIAPNITETDTSLRSNKYRSSRSNQVPNDNGHRSYNGIPLKDVSIVLRKINSDDQILNKSCEILKEAIMTKTKRMFDARNEVSVKTHRILGVDRVEEEEGAEDSNQSIGSTPKDQCESECTKERRQQNRLRKRRLFNTYNSACNSSNLRPLQLNEIQSSSIVLAGSNKRPGASNTSGEAIDPREIEYRRTNHSVISNTSEGEGEFTAVPIGCSTMINDQVLDAEGESGLQIANNLSSSADKHTKKSIVSMEITDIHERFMQCDNQSLRTIAGSSVNTVRTSLNVNMSVEGLSEDIRCRREKDIDTSVSDEALESINTVHTSLQMNTSLDTSNRLSLQRSSIRSGMSISNDTMNKKKGTSIVDENNTSLTDRLKNVFIRSNEHVQSNKVCTERDQASDTSTGQSYIEATPYPMSRSVFLRSQLKHNANNNRHNGDKSLHATDANFSKTRSHTLGQKGRPTSNNDQERSVNDTIIMDDSSLCRTPGAKPQVPVIIDESCNESKLENDQNAGNLINLSFKRKCKKKLLPLHECSQLLTFSPVEQECVPPKYSTFAKRHRKGKKQAAKTKFNAAVSASNAKHIEEQSSKQSLLEDDTHSFSEKKKQKAKKPKKVVSKKITVKKIVNEDILKRLEENREIGNKSQMVASVSSRNSANDFQSLKRLSTTQLSRRKAQRLNIVVTGLSNDDKNIVKSVVRTLGLARIELNVTKRTTHVVTTGVRTVNLLHGIIRGCWLVSLEWVLQSLENNAWLDPEKYEMTHFSKAAMENRKDKQLFGRAYVPELFAATGYIYVGNDTTPPCTILKDLIKTAGGFITESPETAKIIIGAEGVKESWVLDCITTGELQACNQYRRR